MRKALFIVAATVAAGSSVYADKVKLEQTPPAVQQAIRSKAGGAEVEDIDRNLRNGQVTYEASFKLGGSQQELLVSEAGTILRDVVGAPTTTSASVAPTTGLSNDNLKLSNKINMPLNSAPVPVQNAIRQHAGGVPIDTIRRGIWNQQNIYEAVYNQNGQRMVFQVQENGMPVISPTPAIPTAPAPGFQPKFAGLSDFNVPLSGGSKLQFGAAPREVQRTVTQLSNGARIEDMERGQWNGRNVYQAAYKKDGQHVELQVLDDGSVLTKAPGGGALAAGQIARQGRFHPRYAGLTDTNVQLSGGSKLSFDSAPQAVRDTVTRVAAGAPVEDMERGTWNGRTVYQAAFKKFGQTIELQVLEDGALLTHAPAGSSVGAPPVGTINSGQQP